MWLWDAGGPSAEQPPSPECRIQLISFRAAASLSALGGRRRRAKAIRSRRTNTERRRLKVITSGALLRDDPGWVWIHQRYFISTICLPPFSNQGVFTNSYKPAFFPHLFVLKIPLDRNLSCSSVLHHFFFSSSFILFSPPFIFLPPVHSAASSLQCGVMTKAACLSVLLCCCCCCGSQRLLRCACRKWWNAR